VGTDARTNRVVVGPRELLSRRWLRADRVSWVAGAPPTDGPFEASVSVRSHGDDVPAVVTPGVDDAIEIEFESSQRALAPGQSAAVYHGDEVLGGGRIVATR
jgi:tRNA-specific 2-thiouridylase